VRFEQFAHCDLFAVSLLMQQLGFTAMQGLRYAAGFVGFSSFALASSLFVIQSPSMLLGVSLNVLVLRHCCWFMSVVKS